MEQGKALRLKELLDGVEITGRLPGEIPDGEITGISTDSRAVKEGDLFICIRGGREDGHLFAGEAEKRGAAYILAEKTPDISDKSKLILTGDTHRASSEVWYSFYGRPAESMTKVAVTGTAGKTSTVFILRELLAAAGHRVGVITTIKSMSVGRELELGENGGSSVSGVCGAMTTPDPEFFWQAAAEMKKDGCDTLIYEASSQSILRKSVSAVTPDLCVYTNLSEEHMDAHGTMENYFAAKASLLCGVKKAVVNIDDGWFCNLPRLFSDCDFIKVSAHPERVGDCDVCALRYRGLGEDGIEYVYFSDKAVFRVVSPHIGFHSVYNTMEAAAAAISLGADPMSVQETLAGMDGIDGRMYRVRYRANPNRGNSKLSADDVLPSVFIDYAHTPKALESACRALYEIKKSKKSADIRLRVLFGCGGDRDKTKRPLMAQAAQKYADSVIITSDNPRSENPDEIIDDILSGIDRTKPYTVIPDRRAAIKYALNTSGAGDIVLLAGKGHEKYEITRDGMRPFDEEKITTEAFDEIFSRRLK